MRGVEYISYANRVSTPQSTVFYIHAAKYMGGLAAGAGSSGSVARSGLTTQAEAVSAPK